MEKKAKKRLFFALEIIAHWPEELPAGRLLREEERHMTLAFIGNSDWDRVSTALLRFPEPPFKVGFVANFDHCLFLPEHHPNVACWHVKWLEDSTPLYTYQKQLSRWLHLEGLLPQRKDRGWLPHVTLCRQPFNEHQWSQSFSPLPLATGAIHLYESLGNLKYQPIWSFPLLKPYVEIEHVADIAYNVFGSDIVQIYLHAQGALANAFPSLLPFCDGKIIVDTLDDIIIALNSTIAAADSAIGIPCKAVSFHGDLESYPNGLLKWEMIIDV